MNEPTLRPAQPLRRTAACDAPSVEAIRDCITPILTSATIARSLSDDRRAQLALDIIERQTHRLTHLLKEAFGEAFGVDARQRFD